MFRARTRKNSRTSSGDLDEFEEYPTNYKHLAGQRQILRMNSLYDDSRPKSGSQKIGSNVAEKEDLIRARLAVVADAFDDSQENRNRDAVFRYLKTVFKLVSDFKGRKKSRRLVRRAYRFANIVPVDKDADPFAAVIRCTCERRLDNKVISKYSRALQYVALRKKPPVSWQFRVFMKRKGGINACARRYARLIKEKRT